MRSLTGASGSYAEVGNVGAGITTFEDNPTPDGQTYYYMIQAYNSIGSTNSVPDSEYSLLCKAELSNSSKKIDKVNGVNYVPNSTTIQNNDLVTFLITIVNSNTATEAGVLSSITDTFTNIACPCTATLNGTPITVSGTAPNLTLGVTGTIPIGANWTVLLNARAALPLGVTALMQNKAVINCVSQTSGIDCSTEKTVSFILRPVSATSPQFREVGQ
jgi:hypothetical protein